MYKYADMIYEGKKLKEYCSDMNYDYDNVYLRLKYIFKTKRFNKLSKKSKIELAINRYNNRDNYKYSSYIYKGKRLKDYCKDNNIDMQYMYSRLIAYEKSSRKRNLPLEIKIQMAINCYNGINNFIYANMEYKGKRLSDYCIEHNIKYSRIGTRIYHDRRKGYITDFPDESRIDLYIERYKKQEKLMSLKKNINLLKGKKLSNLKYKMIACELNINYDKAFKLYKKTRLSDIGKAMILTWY